MSTLVQQRLEQVRGLGESICAALMGEVRRLGFSAGEVALDALCEASFELSRDPASGEYSLVGTWRNRRGEQTGCILFHADGTFFAEQDVVRAHPSDTRWFVEAVTAFGRAERITAEPRLMANLA